MGLTARFISLLLALGITPLCPASDGFRPEHHAIIKTDRADGRYISSRGIAQELLRKPKPSCGFPTEMKIPSQFEWWHGRVVDAMRQLMQFPTDQNIKAPVLIKTIRRDGYRVEKWEAYPFPSAAAPFLLLVPDAVSDSHPAPLIFCIPSSGQTKEQLAGETSFDLDTPPVADPSDNAMALHYVKQGWIAIAVDNAGSGESADIELAAGRKSYDDANLARVLLDLGWHWLGYTSYVDQCILDWAKRLPSVKKDRIVLSGFSLGTEPLMVLGVLNSDIYAFVYNDFVCRTWERALVMTMPDKNGNRPSPNSIRHLVPGFLQQFDFPDLIAALAPRPVFCTEGGIGRDFNIILRAYDSCHKGQNFKYLHQPRFADPSDRYSSDDVSPSYWRENILPEGLDRNEYFRLANVDPANHFFKKDAVIPWLKELFNSDKKENKQ